MAIHLLEGLFLGMRNSQQIVGQRQQLLALGALSAGLTHELNNPAAAAVRATAALRERVAGMRHKLAMLAHDELAAQAARAARRRAGGGRQGGRHCAPALRHRGGASARTIVGEWLEERGVSGSWELAPIFVAAGTSTEFLDRIASRLAGRPAGGRRPLARLHPGDRAAARRDHRLGDPDLLAGLCGQAVLATWTAHRTSASTSTTGSRARW